MDFQSREEGAMELVHYGTVTFKGLSPLSTLIEWYVGSAKTRTAA